MADKLDVEVAYALPEVQWVLAVALEPPATVRDAIEASGILALAPEIQLGETPVGVFGEKVPWDQTLSEGDRVELYRPLLLDPKERRRNKAKKA